MKNRDLLLTFTPGDPVAYDGPQKEQRTERQKALIGKTATVQKIIKRRLVVRILWDDTGESYDAAPYNVTHLNPVKARAALDA